MVHRVDLFLHWKLVKDVHQLYSGWYPALVNMGFLLKATKEYLFLSRRTKEDLDREQAALYNLDWIGLLNLGAGKGSVIQWARWDRSRISGLKSQNPRWPLWRLTFLCALSAILTPFLTGSLPNAGFLNNKICIIFHVRFGKPDPRNAALVTTMTTIGEEFKRSHQWVWTSWRSKWKPVNAKFFFQIVLHLQPNWQTFPNQFSTDQFQVNWKDVNGCKNYVHEKWKSPCHQIVSARIHKQSKVGVWHTIQGGATLIRDSVKSITVKFPRLNITSTLLCLCSLDVEI